jgi:hypothetical protein
MHFMPIYPHRRRRTDAQANVIPLNGGHNSPDLLANDDRFTNAPRKH